uniref:RNA (guanine-9-)-methyltransferase domain-containing protein 1 n=1 Tax=Tetranychus urticae TaxID=32264 RepID=T1KU61_TETUR
MDFVFAEVVQHFFQEGNMFTKHHSDSSNEDDFMDVIYEELTVESFRELIKNSDDEKIIKEILSLYEYQKFDNGEIPSTIKINQMVELMKMPRDFWQKRFKKLLEKEIYLKYKKKMKSLKPKSLSYNELQNMIDKGVSPTMGLKFDPLTGAPIYGEWLNSHFTRLRHLEYRCSFIPNLLAAFLYGQKILIDCDYEYTVGDAKRIIFDLQKAMALNRSASSPFNMVVTGLRDTMLRELLDRHKKECLSTLLPSLSFHEETFTELYKDQKLIYLTPHSDKDLCEFDNDAIYIIGGLSIRSTAPHSFKKASSLKIPNYRFPLSFLPFRAMRGAKSLEIRECVSILLHFKEFGDIKEAVSQGIDVHRIKTLEELEQEQRLRFKKLQSNERRYTKRVKP